jgi:hypothetical protein
MQTPSRAMNVYRTVAFFLLPLLVFVWTSIQVLAPYTLGLGVVALLIAIAMSFVKSERFQLSKTIIHGLVILLLVGGTGWFLSPFFFLLYLMPMYLGFLYVPAVSFGFLAALLLVFTSSLGEVDLAFDIMTLLSLLIAIPLIIYLRKKYLVLRQSTKDILILQDDSGIKDADTITKLLSNRVTNLGVTVRQPLTFIKQAATLLLDHDLSAHEAATYIKRIKTTAAETLDHVRKFEGDTSSNEVLVNPQARETKTVSEPKL